MRMRKIGVDHNNLSSSAGCGQIVLGPHQIYCVNAGDRAGILLRAKDPKVQCAQVCMSVAGLVHLGIAGRKHWP